MATTNVEMVSLTNDCAAAAARIDAAQPAASVQLRDLVQRHAGQLEQLLGEQMQQTNPLHAQAFRSCADIYRGQGRGAVASWLYGVTLKLLRDAFAQGQAERFVLRLHQAFPSEFSRPLLILALGGGSYAACSIYLCKPAAAAASDISLPASSDNWVRQYLG